MRKYLVASLVGHVGVTLVGSLLSLNLVSPPPAFTTMKVDLQSMTLPEREAPKPEPEPEVETPEVEPPPREVPKPPPDLVRPPQDVAPDPAPPEPQPEVDLRPPDPDLPPVTEVPEPEPVPIQPEDVDFTEPEEVAPREAPIDPPPPEPEPEVEVPVVAAPPQSVGQGGEVQATSSDGVDDYYLALVQRKIGRRWQPTPAGTGGRSNVEVVVSFRIGPGGEVIGPSVATASGLTVFDRQALRVVIEAAPLPKPPPRFSRTGVEINFHFVYNPEG